MTNELLSRREESYETSLTDQDIQIILPNFINFVTNVCKLLLDGDKDLSNIFDKNNIDNMKKLSSFLKYNEETVLFVQRMRVEKSGKIPEYAVDRQEMQEYKYLCSLEMIYTDNAHGVAFIKKDSKEFQDELLRIRSENQSTISWNQLLQCVGIHEGNPFELFHNFLAKAFEPYFNSYSQLKYKPDNKESKIGLPTVLHNLQELKVSLYQCQQTMKIPYVNVLQHVHPQVRKWAEQIENVVDAINDPAFINEIVSGVFKITKDIRHLTRLQAEPHFDNTLQEINYWAGLEKALLDVEAQIKSPEIELTLEILKKKRRFQQYTAMKTSGLEEALKKAKDYNSLLRDLPIHELLTVKDIHRMTSALDQIFTHLNSKIKTFVYPLERAGKLIEAISKDLHDQLYKALLPKQLLHADFNEFESATSGCIELFSKWSEHLKAFDKIAKSIVLQKSSTSPMRKLTLPHTILQKRIENLTKFRIEHEELRLVINRVFPPSHKYSGTEMSSIEQVNMAYEEVKSIGNKCLDTTPEGCQLWDTTMKSYREKIDKIETYIARKLRDKLGSAKTANEMFKIFSKFNALFFKPKIRGAVQEYQTRLIEKVKEDIKHLEEKFKQHYGHSEASVMSSLRDLPSVSGAVIWVKQMEKRLNTYMNRVVDVFGKGWERLAILRRPDSLWALNESLANFIGVPLTKLKSKFSSIPNIIYKSEIFGTAVALAFLELVYKDKIQEWESMAQQSKLALEKEELKLNQVQSTLDIARNVLKNLGVGSRHIEEKNLRIEGERFRKKLNQNIEKLITNWDNVMYDSIRKWKLFQITNEGRSNASVTIRGPIFTIDEVKNGKLELNVNFNKDIIVLIKEIRNLKWLDQLQNIRSEITLAAFAATEIYPYAISLMESINIFYKVYSQIKPDIMPLCATSIKQVEDLLGAGFKLSWNQPEGFEKYSKDLSDAILSFQMKISVLISRTNDLMEELNLLKICPLEKQCFSDSLTKMQKIIDDMNLESYSNLKPWVQQINSKLEVILLERMYDILSTWLSEFHELYSQDAPQNEIDDENIKKVKFVLLNNLKQSPVQLEIKIFKRQMYIDPPLEKAREILFQHLHNCLSWICGLPILQSDRFDQMFSTKGTYKYLLGKMQKGLYKEACIAIEKILKQVSNYVETWLQYQTLWRVDNLTIYSRLGDDLKLWLDLISDVKKAKAIIDTSETSKCFGLITINYKEVQSKINVKYDDTMRDIILKFRTKLGICMKELYTTIFNHRQEIESTQVTSNYSDAIKFIIMLQTIKKHYNIWKDNIEQFKLGQNVFEQYHVRLPDGWIHIDNIEGEWSAFNQILSRRNEEMESVKQDLIKKISEDEQILEKKIQLYLSDWKQNKPLNPSLRSKAALNIINTFDARLNAIREESQRINVSKEVLDLEIHEENVLKPFIEELEDIKRVWCALKEIEESLQQIRETLFNSVAVSKIRAKLDNLIKCIREYPSWMLQYAAVNRMLELLRRYNKENLIIKELRSEAIKPRHWNELMKRLNVNWNLAELTLGDIWDVNITINEAIFKNIIRVAQGELVIELCISRIKEKWANYQFELVNYHNKCRLIKGWDDIFNIAADNLKDLSAMRTSPYFKIFEDECVTWENKIDRIQFICNLWIDVQRVWIYLEGIFTGSADIQNMLPAETRRFTVINNEFISLMRKVQKHPLVIDVVSIPNISNTLKKLSESLSKVQKALGEYLERQRSAFSRFYFVGDDDLLEIIGQGNDPERVQKHLRKMFAGIASIKIDNQRIVAMVSKEGEMVQFVNAIELTPTQKADQWLKLLETEMRVTLATLTGHAIQDLESIYLNTNRDEYCTWIQKYPAQLIILASQVVWTHTTEKILSNTEKSNINSLERMEDKIDYLLKLLTTFVLQDNDPIMRKKIQLLITELVHQRYVIRKLISEDVKSPSNFSWLYFMRFYWNHNIEKVTERITIRIANACFTYGYEYLGLFETLVQTPLTDRCYLALTQALHARLGGSPFGPAGTGKTETVKALGAHLGRFVLVFNCDENFDFKAMGRIFVGICQCGAWGCFDEFNRLEERILSAVSQIIQQIQLALRENFSTLEIVERNVNLNPNTGIFITMNPGYAGRSNLPDNLKQLFRSIAMVKPDKTLISQVIQYSQGFSDAEELAQKIVLFFDLCNEQLSKQPHYDFGLRALKSVLINAGHLKREAIQKHLNIDEKHLLIQSVVETVIPKLVGDDIELLECLLEDIFPGCSTKPSSETALRDHISTVCKKKYYECNETWTEKLVQLYQIQKIHHGIILVGPAGCGKTSCWKVLFEALDLLEKVNGVSYVIDPKAITKDELFGALDSTTREWTDGIFTHILRKINDNARGESQKRHWIVFDGDVDPDWVEYLNSVLDDNKVLTLPNGERLTIPPNVKILFEVQDLKYATLATVSRCGMIWFSENAVSLDMIVRNYIESLKNIPLDEDEPETPEKVSPSLIVQRKAAKILETHFQNGLIHKSMDFVMKQTHIMDIPQLSLLTSMFSLFNKSILDIIEYNLTNNEFPMEDDLLEKFVSKKLIYSILWGFGASLSLKSRVALGEFIASASSISIPDNKPLIDFEVNMQNGEWAPWINKVPVISLDSRKAATSSSIIPTVDTTRHEDLLRSWILGHKPLILCGPPGSGKTMTMSAVLHSLPDYYVVFLNFSSATKPDLILKTFEQYCTITQTKDGAIMHPIQEGKRLIIFCDEINLPSLDKYGTQRVITFMRQLVEQNGFWRASDRQWIRLDKIQFVGACNPPTDAGRVPLSKRFLRYAPILFVDFPVKESLIQIYKTFNSALLELAPNLSQFSNATTDTMVEFYIESQQKFTPDIQPHYVYSPRELSRWVRALYAAIKPLERISLQEFVILLIHEGIRIFSDRLVCQEERDWTEKKLDSIVLKYFPTVSPEWLAKPILFSSWMHKNYVQVDREKLLDHVKARLSQFAEEELEVELVLFDYILEHILRIDRVLKQPLGHMLLVGVSGAGKTCLSRFAAWMNGFSVFQIKAHRNYTLQNFEQDLRNIMKTAGCKGEKICFIFDESNVLEPAFIEYMNSLLASGEVPGLFEGEEYATLIQQCKIAIQEQGITIDTEEEIFRWFTNQVQENLHIIFTMNPQNPEFYNRTATSPALFNRCVIDWFGDWPDTALQQVAYEFTKNINLEGVSYEKGHESLTASIVSFHKEVINETNILAKRQTKTNYITPRHFLDFIHQFRKMYKEKTHEIQEQQVHIVQGLKNLAEAECEINRLKQELNIKEKELQQKNKLAQEKLHQLLINQKQSEEKKQESLQLKVQLEKQREEIESRKKIAEAALADVQPMLEEARMAVKRIRRVQLNELQSMAHPPRIVQKTMEAVHLLLTNATKVPSWSDIRSFMRSDDFIPKVVSFDSANISPKMRKFMEKNYLSDPEFTFEKVNKGSKAAGPMCQWIASQVRYSTILEKIAPLEAEKKLLEQEFDKLAAQQDELNKKINQLEQNIAQYTTEYGVLISEIETIKLQMKKVVSKVDRSNAMLQSLSSETQRWISQSKSYDTQIATVVGDVILSSAFVTYLGYFDEYFRKLILSNWMNILEKEKLCYQQNLSVINYLSQPDRQLSWSTNKLPADNLCIENAIILSRFNRYPLIIDPTGQATEFLLNEYKNTHIVKTSFLDNAFMKNLESALRFGTPLIVHDAEHIDPILNPILNREVRRIGGRNLVRVGHQEIDISPSFSLFLVTRDTNFQFPPDVCSRVTFVNFTVTPMSLQSQCLNIILQAERPDINKQRTEQLRLQGHYKAKLRELEDSLLNSLSEAKGNILEDEKLFSTLESLKKNASEIEEKVKESDKIMQQMTEISDLYYPLAIYCCQIYFTLQQLEELHFLYQFSLSFIFDILHYVLHHTDKKSHEQFNVKERVDSLVENLFYVVNRRVSRCLLNDDELAFALRLCQIRINGTHDAINEDEQEFLLRGGNVVLDSQYLQKYQKILPQDVTYTTSQLQMIAQLSNLQGFENLEHSIKTNQLEWREFILSENGDVPCFWKYDSAIVNEFRKLLLLKIFKPERLVKSAYDFVETVFGPNFLRAMDINIHSIVFEEANCSIPLLLVSTPGFDPSNRIDDLATKLNKKYISVAMGSSEGYEIADKKLRTCIEKGEWLLLKNVHLSPQYLIHLEKRLHELRLEKQVHSDFRLFLTAEIHPSLPSNLLRRSLILVFEPASGIKAKLHQTFNSINEKSIERKPVERLRLYLLVSWFHSIVQERLRYVPLGWSKKYEFSESDFRGAIDTIDDWIDIVAKGRDHVMPEQLPWKAVTTLLCESIYGGRIDNEFDYQILNSFLQQLFVPSSYKSDHKLVDSTDKITMPEGTTFDQFREWIESLPAQQTPDWLGLPSKVRIMTLINEGRDTLRKLARIQNMYEEQPVYQDENIRDEEFQSWKKYLVKSVKAWLEMLPEKLEFYLPSTKITNPLHRYFQREIQAVAKLLKTIRTELMEIYYVCTGELKITNHHRSLIEILQKGDIPHAWKLYPVVKGLGVNGWITDFKKRLSQLNEIGNSLQKSETATTWWLGGLVFPGAFITATRQLVAQTLKWPLNSLELVLQVGDSNIEDEQSFIITGLVLECAKFVEGKISITADLSENLPPTKLKWVQKEKMQKNNSVVRLPLYLNQSRKDMLCSINIECSEYVAKQQWYQLGAALIAWNNN